MSLDAVQAADRVLWNALTGDAELQTIMEVPVAERLHLVMAPPDPPMPYIVRRWAGSPIESIYDATCYVDLWDHATTATRIYSMRRRLVQLLHKSVFRLPSGEAGDIRFYMRSSRQIDTGAADVWRWESVWRVRFFPTVEVHA